MIGAPDLTGLLPDRPKRNPDACCWNCRHAERFRPTPGVGRQGATNARHCPIHQLAVDVTFYCPSWKRALLVSRI